MSESLAVLSIGVPAALQSAVMSVSNIYRESMVNAHGADAVAAITVLGKLDGFIWLILAAIGAAVTTFVGQNYGAGRLDRVKASIKTTSVMALVSTLVFTALFIICRQPLYHFFGAQGAALDIGMYMVLYTAPFYTLYVSMEILASALRGMGKTFVPSVINIPHT